MMRALWMSVLAALLALSLTLPAMAGPIHDAVRAGDLDLVVKLLKKDPSLVHAPDEEDQFRSLPLHFAAMGGHLDIAKVLLKMGADIDGFDTDESTPLHVAALRGQGEMIDLLLANGADVNRRDKNGAYALSFAASSGDPAIVQQILDAGADLNFWNARGITLLHFACNRGLRNLFDVLIERGADINAATEDGATPLNWAISEPGLPMLETVLAAGADPQAATSHGETPLLRAAFRGYPEAARLLLAHGADPNAVDEGGWSPLLAAARDGNAEFVQLLIAHGAEVNAPNERGDTPLSAAVQTGSVDAVEALLAAGADQDSKEVKYGYAPLHVAALKGYGDVAGCLLDHGARLGVRDDSGRTPVELAARYGHKDVVERLSARGAAGGNLDVNECTLAAWERPPDGEAAIWYLGHSGWAVKTRNNFLVFDYHNTDREPAAPGLCNGFVNCDELAGENVTVFVSHEHGDHYDSAIFGWREQLPRVEYVMGCRDDEQSDYLFMAGREKKKVNGMKVMTIESNDTGVGFVVFVDGVTIFHAGDHANRQRDFSGPFQAEVEFLAEAGIRPDIAFMPISGCGFGDQEAVKMGVHYTLETLRPKVFLPMHAGNNSWRYHEFIADCRDQFPETRMDAPINRGDLFRYREGSVTDRLALR